MNLKPEVHVIKTLVLNTSPEALYFYRNCKTPVLEIKIDFDKLSDLNEDLIEAISSNPIFTEGVVELSLEFCAYASEEQHEWV